jgi:hypothetical protein
MLSMCPEQWHAFRRTDWRELCRMICVHLSDEQRRELEQVRRQAVGRVAMRAHMALMSDLGYPVPFIAVIHR